MPECLTLCAIKRAHQSESGTLFQLTNVASLPLSENYNEGKINNPTSIGKFITNFLVALNQKKAPIAISLKGEHIAQEIISCSSAQPFESMSVQTQKYIIDYCQLYEQENGSRTFYTCAIDRSIIMQYQLLAITHRFNVLSISTDTMAHLNLYRYMGNHAHAQNAMASILEKNNNDIASLIPDKILQNIVHIPPSIKTTPINYDSLRIALGAITTLMQS